MRPLATAWIFLLVTGAFGQQAADILIINAQVKTMSARVPAAEAVAIVGNRIDAVGNTAELKKLISAKTRVIDAGGRLVLPGFNDSHVHFMAIGNQFSTLDLQDVRTPEQLFARLREYLRFLPKGRWIIGSGGTEELFSRLNAQVPSELAADNPVFLYHKVPTTAFANGSAMRAANLKTGPGIVSGAELQRIRRSVPPDHTRRWAEIAEIASNYAASFGITSVQDTDSDNHAAVYRNIAAAGRLKVRIYDCHGLPDVKKYAAEGLRAGAGSAMVRVGCLKGTAEDDNHLRERVIEADKAGMQVSLHAIGRAQVETALDVFESAVKANGHRDRRFRIEHFTGSAASHLDRSERVGAVVSVQPALFFGRRTYKELFVFTKDPVMQMAFGSDAPMADIDPIHTVSAAVKQGFSLTESLRAFTHGSAYAEYQEKEKGILEPGLLADVILMSDHVFVDSSGIGRSSVDLTIMDGKIVYEADK
jgi:predicted amidohydrolase YtcJ